MTDKAPDVAATFLVIDESKLEYLSDFNEILVANSIDKDVAESIAAESADYAVYIRASHAEPVPAASPLLDDALLNRVLNAVTRSFNRTEEGDLFVDVPRAKARVLRVLQGRNPPDELRDNAKYELEIATELAAPVAEED